MKKTTYTSNLYGVTYEIETSGETKMVGDQAAGLVNMQEDVYRQTGLRRELLKAEKFKEALDKPGNYLTLKQAALEKLGSELGKRYEAEFSRIVQLGYTAEEARKRAMQFAQYEKTRLMQQHEEEYPTSLTGSVIQSAFNLKKNGGDNGKLEIGEKFSI